MYFSLTQQSARVAEAMEGALKARGCDVRRRRSSSPTNGGRRGSRVPDDAPFPQIASILPAQLRHKTGEIRIPPEAQEGDYDLVLFASPTWWFQTSMPMRSYLESPAAQSVLDGKPFACASISRRYYRFNLGQRRSSPRRTAGGSIDKTHFVAAGGQVKSMLSWLGLREARGEAAACLRAEDAAAEHQARLQEQARSFVDGVVDEVLEQRASAGGESSVMAALARPAGRTGRH